MPLRGLPKGASVQAQCGRVLAGTCGFEPATEDGDRAMAAWTIGVEISGSHIDGEGLVRLVDVFAREFPDFKADCALWSGWLGVHTTVTAPTSAEALEAALK